MKTLFKALACALVLAFGGLSFATGQAVGYSNVFHTNGFLVLGIDNNGTSAALSNSSGFLSVMGSNFSNYKPIIASSFIGGSAFTVSTLPTCNSSRSC